MDAASIPANIPIGVLSPVFMLIFCLIHKFLLFSPLLCKTTENHRSATDNRGFLIIFVYFCQHCPHLFPIQRLCNMIIHSCLFGLHHILRKCIGRHGDDSLVLLLSYCVMTLSSFHSLSAAFTCSISLPCFICFLYWCSSFLNPLQSSCSPLLY